MELKRRFAQEQKNELIQIEQPLNQIETDLAMEEKKVEESNEGTEEITPSIPSRQMTYKRHSTSPLVKSGFVLIIFAGLTASWLIFPQHLGLDQQTTMVQLKQVEKTSKANQQTNSVQELKQVSATTTPRHENSVNSAPKFKAPLPIAVSPQTQEDSKNEPEKNILNKPASQIRMERHTVTAGETLYRISMNYYRSGKYTQFLANYNHLADPTSLALGDTILIPFPPDRVN